MAQLLEEFTDVFRDEPGNTILQQPMLKEMQANGIIKPSHYRCLNGVSEFDAYPMPRIDELIDRLDKAKYISTVDLTLCAIS